VPKWTTAGYNPPLDGQPPLDKPTIQYGSYHYVKPT
jgi:hypothetical protein